MPIPYTREELRQATHELLIANGLRECYIRPIVFRGYGTWVCFHSRRRSTSRSQRGRGVPTWARTRSEVGIRAKVSSWRRMNERLVRTRVQGDAAST